MGAIWLRSRELSGMLASMLIDPEFEHLLAGASVYHMPRGGSYLQTADGTPVHRVVMGVEGISAKVIQVDHINGDGLDNRRANLRLATPSQNAMNRKPRSDNTSGVRGVSWSKQYERWEVRVKVAGKQKFGGRYEHLADAERAAVRLREELHGRFARHD